MAECIRTALARAGFPTDVYASLDAARYWLQRESYAVLVLDRGLPDGDGLALVAALRARGCALPCLVLTARDAIHDRVEGLEHGADDYLAKPFAIEELVARVRALLRRPPQIATRRYRIGNLAIDVDAGQVDVAGRALRLGPKEFRLVCALAEADGGLRTHAQLHDAVFGTFSEASDNALEVVIHRLRVRLRTSRATVAILNERGIGFALEAADAG
jgi:DNA-binding response OmpR family regulator